MDASQAWPPSGGAQPFPGQPQPSPAQPQPYPGQPQAYPGQPQPYAGQPQPYPGQPYPGQPYGGQPYGQGQPSYYPTEPPAKRPMWLFVLIGVVVLALIVGIVVIATRSSGGGGGGGGGGNPPTPKVTLPEVPPNEVVQNYLQALASGDAATALSHMVTPSDTTFLTNQVLAKSLELAPLTNISVTEGDPETTWVDATYSLGDQSVSMSFEVTISEDVYLLTNGTLKVDVSNIYRRDVGGSINGVSLEGAAVSSIELFPGTYQIELGNPLLVLSTDQFTVTGPSDSAVWDADYSLSEEAPAKIAAAARSRLRGCIAEKQTMTSCNFGVKNPPSNTKKSTINWKISSGNSDYSKAKFELFDTTTAMASKKVSVNCNWRTTSGARYKLTKPITITGVQVDFTDPENMIVTFFF